jgi:hypothetical protein
MSEYSLRWAVYTLAAQSPADPMPPLGAGHVWQYRGDWSSFDKAHSRAARFRSENVFAGLKSAYNSGSFELELTGTPPVVLLWLPEPDEPIEVPW